LKRFAKLRQSDRLRRIEPRGYKVVQVLICKAGIEQVCGDASSEMFDSESACGEGTVFHPR
jgi:hypothetical protein